MAAMMTRRRALRRLRPPRGDPGRQSGMVTAEIATALPVLVALVMAAAWTVNTASTQNRCADAAREAARAAARGEDDTVVQQVAQQTGPDNADVRIERTGDTVTVRVEAHIPLPPPFSGTGPTVRGRAVAMVE